MDGAATEAPAAATDAGSVPAAAAGRAAGASGQESGAAFRVAVLASGSGSNLQAIIDRLHHPRFRLFESGAAAVVAAGAPARECEEPGEGRGEAAAGPGEAQAPAPLIEVVLVLSDVPGCRALERAERAGIATAVLPVRDFRDREQHDLAMVTRLLEVEPDLVVLAGYMRIVSPAVLKTFPWRVINLHPALLPAFPGTHSISDAVHYGVKVTGVTVHFVDPGVDTGPVIAQEPVRVEDGDTPETLAARVHEVEHRLLPATIRLFAAGRVKPPLPGSRVVQVD
jgi:phosphoribosylglycinamide formyltransferase 1